MSFMFYKCSSLKIIILSNGDFDNNIIYKSYGFFNNKSRKNNLLDNNSYLKEENNNDIENNEEEIKDSDQSLFCKNQ